MSNHLRHQSKCDETVQFVFAGDVYKNKLSVFEELEEMGVQVREEDKYEKWIVCFDFEAISVLLMKIWMLLKKIHWRWKRMS